MKKLLILFFLLAGCDSPFSTNTTQHQNNNNQGPNTTQTASPDLDVSANTCDQQCVQCISDDTDGVSDETCVADSKLSRECRFTLDRFGFLPSACTVFDEVEEEGLI
jgi:hypothetical protein